MKYKHYLNIINKNRKFIFGRNESYFILNKYIDKKIACLISFIILLKEFFLFFFKLNKKIKGKKYIFVQTVNSKYIQDLLAEYIVHLGKNNCIIFSKVKNKNFSSLNRPSFNFFYEFLILLFNFRRISNSLFLDIHVHLNYIRFLLYKNAWKNTLKYFNHHSVVFLHNDFDAFSQAAIVSSANICKHITIQHGLPTDEYFPIISMNYLTWGLNSKKIFKNKSVHSNLKIFTGSFLWNKYENKVHNKKTNDFYNIFFISQTHTDIYGNYLSNIIINFLNQLISDNKDYNFRILLHHEEVKNMKIFKDNNLIKYCSKPPHNILDQNYKKRHIVFGISSTALIDAAINNHFVIGINYNPTSSIDAFNIGSPHFKITTPKELLNAVYKLINNNKFRDNFINNQELWLKSNLTSIDKSSLCKIINSLGT